MIIISIKPKIATELKTDTNHLYKCFVKDCGKEYDDPVGKFYKSSWSQLWDFNDKYVPICKSCLNKMYNEWSRRYKSDKTALIICCHYLDIPFYNLLYNSITEKNSMFSVGMYLRQINGRQYQYKTFVNSLIDGELDKSDKKIQMEKEIKWSALETRNKNEAITIIGYDPFEGYSDTDRRFLFNELIKYFDEDVTEDTFKLSQVIQIVNNNNQIRQYDLTISSLDPIKDANDIKVLHEIKSKCVASNDKIAKENEISVKNRSNKEIGKSTLTYLMKDLREKDFSQAEANYYAQLKSEGTLWAINMSQKAIMQNSMFDENDKQEIFELQRNKISDLQSKLDDEQEKNRLLSIDLGNLMEQGAVDG